MIGSQPDEPAPAPAVLAIGGAPVTVSLAAGQGARLTFPGSAGQWIDLGVSVSAPSASVNVHLLSPTGRQLAQASMNKSGQAFHPEPLAEVGDYAVVLDPLPWGKATFDLTLSEPQIGDLPVGAPPLTLNLDRPGRTVRLRFTAAAGQRVSLGVCGVSPDPENQPIHVTILQPNGRRVAEDFASAAQDVYLNTEPLTAGAHTVVVAPLDARQASLSLSLSEPPPDLTVKTTVGGTTETVTTKAPGQQARLTFPGVAGRRVALALSPVQTTPDHSVGLLALAILRPDGGPLYSRNVDRRGYFFSSGPLPADGTYTVVLKPQRVRTFRVGLTLSEEGAPTTLVAGGASVPVTIDLPGQSTRLIFHGGKGQRVGLAVRDVRIPNSFDSIAIAIQSANERWVTSFLVRAAALLDSTPLPADGTYTVVVTSTVVPVSLSLSLTEIAPDWAGAIAVNGDAVEVKLGGGQRARLTFTGHEGQHVNLGISSVTTDPPSLAIPGTVLRPDGKTLAEVKAQGSSADLVLPAPGSYTILLEPQQFNAARFMLNLSEPVAATLQVNGPPLLVALRRPGQNVRLEFREAAGKRVDLAVRKVINAPQVQLTAQVFDSRGSIVAEFYVAEGQNLHTPPLPADGACIVAIAPRQETAGLAFTLILSEPVTGSLTPGAPSVPVVLDRPGRTAVYTFQGKAGERVRLDVREVRINNKDRNIWDSGILMMSVLSPGGTAVLKQMVPQEGWEFTTDLLPASGVYTIVFELRQVDDGSFSLALADALGDVYATVAVGGAPVTVKTIADKQNARVTFHGTAGRRLCLAVIDFRPEGRTAAEVEVLTSRGLIVSSGRAVTRAGDILIFGPLPEIGEYLILFKLGAKSDLTFSLGEIPADVGGELVVGGPPVPVATVAPGQGARLNFPGVAGQRLYLEAADIHSDPAGGYANVSVLRPDSGQLIVSAEFGYRDGSGNPPPWDVCVFSVPVSATYAVKLEPEKARTVRLTLRLQEVPPDLLLDLGVGGPEVQVNAAPVQWARLTFTGNVGQRLWLTVREADDRPKPVVEETLWTVLGPDGKAPPDHQQSINEWVLGPLAAGGSYTIVLPPHHGIAARLTVGLLEVPPDVEGTMFIGGPPFTAAIAGPGQLARVRFDGIVGQRVEFCADQVQTDRDDPLATVRVSDGRGLLLADMPLSTFGATWDLGELPATETYTISFQLLVARSGSVRFTLSEPRKASLATGGPPLALDLGLPGQSTQVTFDATAKQLIDVGVSDVRLDSSDGVVFVAVFGPADSILTVKTIEGGPGGTLTVLTNAEGPHFLVVRFVNASAGSLRLALSEPLTKSLMVGALPTSVDIARLGQSARLTFAGSAGQLLGLGFADVKIGPQAGALAVTLIGPDGQQLLSGTISGDGGRLSLPALPASGQYSLRCVSGGGPFSFIPLLSEPVRGSLAVGAAPMPVAFARAGQGARLTCPGKAGQRLAVGIHDVRLAPAGGYVSVSLRGPDSKPLGSRWLDSAGGELETEPLPADGPYLVVIDPLGGQTGEVTIALREIPPDLVRSVAVGAPPARVSLAAPGQRGRLTFEGTAGQRLGVAITDVHFATSLKPYLTVGVLDPDGRWLARGISSFQGTFLKTRPLPTSKSYLIAIDLQGGNPADLFAELKQLPPDVEAKVAIGGEAATATIALPQQNARFTFSGDLGQELAFGITVPQSDSEDSGRANVFLISPDGVVLSQQSLERVGGYLIMDSLPAKGVYQVVVDPPAGQTGTVTVAVREIPPDATGSVVVDHPSAPVSLNGPGQRARLSVQGSAGRRLSIAITDVHFEPAAAEVFVSLSGPDGELLYSFGLHTAGGYLATESLPTSGAYKLAIDPLAGQTGTLTVAVHEIPPDATGSVAVGSMPVPVSLTAPGQRARLTVQGSAGQRLGIAITDVHLEPAAGEVFVSLSGPDGELLDSFGFGTAVEYLATEPLPVTGAYQLAIDPLAGQTGAFAVTVREVPADATGSGGLGRSSMALPSGEKREPG